MHIFTDAQSGLWMQFPLKEESSYSLLVVLDCRDVVSFGDVSLVVASKAGEGRLVSKT